MARTRDDDVAVIGTGTAGGALAAVPTVGRVQVSCPEHVCTRPVHGGRLRRERRAARAREKPVTGEGPVTGRGHLTVAHPLAPAGLL